MANWTTLSSPLLAASTPIQAMIRLANSGRNTKGVKASLNLQLNHLDLPSLAIKKVAKRLTTWAIVTAAYLLPISVEDCWRTMCWTVAQAPFAKFNPVRVNLILIFVLSRPELSEMTTCMRRCWKSTSSFVVIATEFVGPRILESPKKGTWGGGDRLMRDYVGHRRTCWGDQGWLQPVAWYVPNQERKDSLKSGSMKVTFEKSVCSGMKW